VKKITVVYSVLVTTWKWLINPITIRNPSVVTNKRDNVYNHVSVTKHEVWIRNLIIEHFQIVTTSNYATIASSLSTSLHHKLSVLSFFLLAVSW
jgi:hypothetical protein